MTNTTTLTFSLRVPNRSCSFSLHPLPHAVLHRALSAFSPPKASSSSPLSSPYHSAFPGDAGPVKMNSCSGPSRATEGQARSLGRDPPRTPARSNPSLGFLYGVSRQREEVNWWKRTVRNPCERVSAIDRTTMASSFLWFPACGLPQQTNSFSMIELTRGRSIRFLAT